MKKARFKKSDERLAFLLLSPSILLLAVLIVYPMLSNIRISFLDLPLNPYLPEEFIGIKNYLSIIGDLVFWQSILLTVGYTVLVVIGSTILGLGIAILFNREFKFRGIARTLIILSYVAPSISLIFAWKYMFNSNYGIVNTFLVDTLHLFDKAPLWFDNPITSFILVTLYAIWRYFPYAFISFLAILQTIDSSLYEAAEIDGANAWMKFRVVTIPAIRPVLITVIILRSIWMFYMFNDVYLLTSQVNIVGVYLYKTAFAFNDLGRASAISIVLFIILGTVVLLSRKRLNNEE